MVPAIEEIPNQLQVAPVAPFNFAASDHTLPNFQYHPAIVPAIEEIPNQLQAIAPFNFAASDCTFPTSWTLSPSSLTHCGPNGLGYSISKLLARSPPSIIMFKQKTSV